MSFPTRKSYPSTFPAAAAAASASTSTANATSLQWSQPCRQFKISEILSATKNFDASLVIGKGGQAKVYKGNIMIGSSVVIVAIKRLERQDTTSFNDEINMLSKLRHCNLVSLIGYCNNGNEMILVYEYMCQGTLEEHLHKQSTPLSWIQRLKISIDAARGLDYLHTGTGIDSGVIHRDVKSSNILLHEKFSAKISDFGLSKIGPRNQSTSYVFSNVRGTCGYLDPDYINSYNVDWRCDVYSFGVVLLEMLGRKRALDFNRGSDSLCLLAKWGQNHINEGMLTDMVDSGIRDQISPQCLDAFLRITERCFLVGSDRKRRPTMAEVVSSLESVLNLQVKTNNSPQLQTPTGRTISRKFDKRPFTGHGDHSAHGDPKPPSNMFSDQKIPNSNLKVFSFGDLEKATSNFSRDAVLSDISFGRVFLGWVDKKTFRSSKKGVGIPVAIKRRTHATRLSSIGHAQWLAEANLLGHLSHPNIIRLFGYCNHEQEYLLVYEYMHNESLDKFLHKSRNSIGNRLSWTKLLTILIGVARGINYLHSSRDQIIHHDIRSSSILLDEVLLGSL